MILGQEQSSDVGLVSLTITGSSNTSKKCILISETLGSAGIEVLLSKKESLPLGDMVRLPLNLEL